MALAVVTGASGLLGSNLALALVADRLRVRAIRRPGSRIAHLETWTSGGRGIQWVPGELEDQRSLEAAFVGADVVFHCAAITSVRNRATAEMVRVNVDGTARVIEAVRKVKARRLVYCSSAVTVGVSDDGRPCTEESPWNMPERGLADGYCSTKRQAEELVLTYARAAPDLDVVIVNPTFMFGPNDARLSSGRFITAVAKGQMRVAAPGLNDFVDVRDVARGMIGAWQKGRRGERYLLSGVSMSYAEMGALVARLLGVAPPKTRLPYAAAKAAALAGDAWERVSGREPLVNSSVVAWGYCKDFVFSSEKAKRELGYEVHPVETAVRDAIEWFRANGQLPAR